MITLVGQNSAEILGFPTKVIKAIKVIILAHACHISVG